MKQKIKAPGSIFVNLGMRLKGASPQIMAIIVEWVDENFDNDDSITHIEINEGKVTFVEDVPKKK